MIPKKLRINKQDTEWVLKKGEQVTSDLFIVRFLSNQNNGDKPQFSIVTSTKLAKKAVDRNKLKRRIYEAIRMNMPEKLPLKIVIIPKKRTLNVEYEEIDKDVKNLFSKLKTHE